MHVFLCHAMVQTVNTQCGQPREKHMKWPEIILKSTIDSLVAVATPREKSESFNM